MINQAILSTWMKKHKIKFSVASDGEEAVEKWKGFHIFLLFGGLLIQNPFFFFFFLLLNNFIIRFLFII
jgi:hypothetical protein